MEFEFQELLDIIELDRKYWCKKMDHNCNTDCKYYKCSCVNAELDIKNVRKLAAVCFGSNYEKTIDKNNKK